MINLELRTAADPAALARLAAAEFVRLARDVAQERGRFNVALSGGSTPRRLYELLADDSEEFRARVPWQQTYFYFGDERHVAPDHADSNYRMAREAMFDRLAEEEPHVERMLTESPNATAVASDYERRLCAGVPAGGDGVPRLDLVLLGLGADGHTASLFPGTPALSETERLVVANPVTKLGADRLTITYPVINNAANVFFLVAGRDKADTLRDVLAGASGDEPSDPQDEKFPARLVRPRDGRLAWFTDEAAASSLTA